MCCRDIEPETPPKKPANGTPVWRTARSGEAEARQYLREQGWTWGEHDSAQLTETFQDSDAPCWPL